MFYLGLGIGIFIGTFIGIVIASLCVMAKDEHGYMITPDGPEG